MINSMQKALILKDIRAITTNKRLFSVLLIVPLVMTIFVPSVFMATLLFPSADGFESMLQLLPEAVGQGDVKEVMVHLLLDNIIPLFFLFIPIMAASVMAASSFVGEKEKHTLETLLYCPLSLKQIYQAKILASFLLSMFVSLLSFAIMLIVVEAEIWFVMGAFIPPGIGWLILLVLVSPSVSLIAITVTVQGSAKAQTVEESQQRSAFLIMPIALLAVSQFTGFLVINDWILAGMGIAFAVVAFVLINKSFKGLHYEVLLK